MFIFRGLSVVVSATQLTGPCYWGLTADQSCWQSQGQGTGSESCWTDWRTERGRIQSDDVLEKGSSDCSSLDKLFGKDFLVWRCEQWAAGEWGNVACMSVFQLFILKIRKCVSKGIKSTTYLFIQVIRSVFYNHLHFTVMRCVYCMKICIKNVKPPWFSRLKLDLICEAFPL